MADSYTFTSGHLPLLISVPHDGRLLPEEMRGQMTAAGLAIPDTDWHVAKLYDFAAEFGASVLTAKYSRYVVDLNRSAADEALYPGQVATGLCPLQTFAGENIYTAGAVVGAQEQQQRIARYWQPYHDKLSDTLRGLRERHGYAVLWDAHSIPSRVPRLFTGELPVLNIGTWEGRSCAQAIEHSLREIAAASDYESVLNGRFKGGYITRHYGNPQQHIHAIQLEIAQRAYMCEMDGIYNIEAAKKLQMTLRKMLRACTI